MLVLFTEKSRDMCRNLRALGRGMPLHSFRARSFAPPGEDGSAQDDARRAGMALPECKLHHYPLGRSR